MNTQVISLLHYTTNIFTIILYFLDIIDLRVCQSLFIKMLLHLFYFDDYEK